MFEFVYDFDKRVQFIKDNKLGSEQPLRLARFKLIPDELLPSRDSPEYLALFKAWAAYNKAWAAYNEARAAYNEAGAAYNKARAVYNKARAAYNEAFGPEMLKLHAQLCPDCPFDGKTIFTRKGKDGNWY